MQKSVLIFSNGSILQVHCSLYDIWNEASKWAALSVSAEVWIVPSSGLKKLIRAFRENPSFLMKAIRNTAGAVRRK